MELSNNAWTFGHFTLTPARQLLLRDGVPVRIGSRALDILTLLVRRHGELVGKHELIAAVWPDTFVDESNLKVNICGVRRALGDTRTPPRYIATVAGRGYRFVAPVQSSADLRSRGSLAIVDHFHLRALPLLTVRSTLPHV